LTEELAQNAMAEMNVKTMPSRNNKKGAYTLKFSWYSIACLVPYSPKPMHAKAKKKLIELLHLSTTRSCLIFWMLLL